MKIAVVRLAGIAVPVAAGIPGAATGKGNAGPKRPALRSAITRRDRPFRPEVVQ